jgi:hypothetical protein
MPPDSPKPEESKRGIGCAVAKYFVLLLSLVPLSPILYHNTMQYSVQDLIGTVIMLVMSPIIALIEAFMFVLLRESEVDRILFGAGTLLAALPILMFCGNWIFYK